MANSASLRTVAGGSPVILSLATMCWTISTLERACLGGSGRSLFMRDSRDWEDWDLIGAMRRSCSTPVSRTFGLASMA